jgi:hypothetical protein
VIVRKDLEDYKEKKLQEIQELEAKRDQELAETMDHYDRQIDTVKGKIVAADELIAEHADELPESPGELV